MANQSKIARYNKYLDRTVIIAVIAVIALGAVLAFFWLYYVPHTEKKALKVNFIDQRDPSSMVAPSTTEQSIGLKSVASNNMQAPSSSSNLVGNNDPLGNYQKAQLRQFCSIGDTSNAINLPEFFEYQQCDEGLKCTSGILKEGAICLADIGSFCSSYSDCVPGADACVNNICTVINYDTKLNAPCENDLDCQLNSFEDQINNHICVNNICKINLFPYDGGCQFDSDCPPLTPSDYHQVRCVKSNNFSDTLIGASIISVNSDGLSVRLDVDFSFKNIIDSAENFMLNVIDKNTDINDIQNFYPYTISNVSDGDKTMKLTELEFYQGTYPSFTLSTGISVTFGDRALQEAFVGTNTKTGGPYGICLDLLPLGGPADLKIANITIPGVSNSKVLDNKIVSSSRLQTGRIGQFCLTTAENNSSLGCGKTKLLDKIWQMECGYNYNYNELQVDNLFYNLFQDQWDIDLIGSCMIKNTTKLQPCNNQTNGCQDPNICLPILDPLSNTFNYYCVPQFRSQLCDTTNQCPEGYTCQGKNCLSNSNNLAVLKTDCINGNLANNYDIFVYNPERSQYYPLNLNVQDFFTNNSNLSNINFKMSEEYQTVTSFESLGINSKTRLPKNLLVYGTSTFAGTNDTKIRGAVYSIQDNKYQLDKNFSIQVNKDNPIHDINLVQGKLAVVQKKTISGFREFALKVSSIQNLGGYFQINLENINNDLWFNFNILRHDVKYDFFLYSSDGKYNYKGNGTVKIAIGDGGILVDSIQTNVSLPAYDSSSSQDVYIVFNTNQYAFNNNRYYNALNTGNYSNFSNLTGVDGYTQIAGDSGEKMWLPSFWNTALTPSGMGDYSYGESSFLIPLVYRNKGTGIAPDYTGNYTPIENGDRIKLVSDMVILNMRDFNSKYYYDLTDPVIDGNQFLEISNNSYLYTEKSTRYKYFNNKGVGEEVYLNNIILNLHPDFLSSEGNVPIFEYEGIEYPFHNQNLLYKNQSETTSGIPFTVYDDMVNYTVNFLTLNSDGLYELSESETFIGVSTDSNSYGKIYLDNGINNSMTYSFEKDTEVDFKFYNSNDKNYMMITSTVEGVSSYHNYVQKIEYQIESGSTTNGLEQFQNFDVSDENYYDKFFYNTYTNTTGGYYNSIRFKYLDQFMAPKPKSLYFDNSVAQNTISSVEENLFNSDPNAISIFSNFYNNDLIEEQGTDDIDLISNNYSNKAPPIASYSTLNKVTVNNQDDQINIQYDGVNFSSTQEFNYVEIDNGISLDYTASNNCVDTANNDGQNYITLRDSEIIEIFLSNPSSEIVLQKNGDSLEDFYINGVSGVKEGATYASKQFTSKTSNLYTINTVDFTNYSVVDYGTPSYVDLQGFMKNKNLEINRSVVSIKEYNIFLDENAKIQEFMVIKLNAPIDIFDTYIKNCFNSSNKWKIWHNNFVPLTYYNSLDIQIRAENNTTDKIYVSADSENYEEQLINIMDGSVLWTGCQSSEKDLGSKLSKTSYNKLMFYNDNENKFSIYNAHDGYYYAQQLDGNDNSLIKIIDNAESEFKYTRWKMLEKYNDDIEFFENALPVNYLSPITVNITPTFSKYHCNNSFNYYQNLYLDSQVNNTLNNIDVNSNFKFFLSNAFDVITNKPRGIDNVRVDELLTSDGNSGSLKTFPISETYPGNKTYGLENWDTGNDTDFFKFFNSQCIPKKVKFWNINQKNLLMYYLYPGVTNTVSGDVDKDDPSKFRAQRMTAHAPQNPDKFIIIPYSNKDFLYFKKKYIKPTIINKQLYNILSLSGNNYSDSIVICKKLDNNRNPDVNGQNTTQFRLSNRDGNNKAHYTGTYNWTPETLIHYNVTASWLNNQDSDALFDTIIFPANETFSLQYGFDTIYQNKIKGINTRTEPNSFKLNNVDYINSHKPLNIYNSLPNQDCTTIEYPSRNEIGFAMYYTQDGYYEIKLSFYKQDIPVIFSKNNQTYFEGFLEMRPQYSSSICTPDQFKNYNQTLYMINNLFLSSLPKQIDTFQYLNLNILDDYIISNLFYTNVNNNGVVKTKRKGFGLINFKINRAPIFSNTQKDANSFNLINYDEVRFPSWFTERYISRLNAIPRIKSVFTSIREGNIFDSMRYYVYLQYSTVDSDDPNDQILFMTTDVDQNTVLENEGIPYTLSLTQGDIPTAQLERLTKFEPFNKFLFTVSGSCN